MHTGNFLWGEDSKTVEMKRNDNDMIVDTDNDQSEVDTDQNHICVEILVFGLENTPDTSSTNRWEGFVGKIDFDDISDIKAYAKPRKLLSAENNGSNTHTELTGYQDEISNLFRFKWFYWCYFCDSNQ